MRLRFSGCVLIVVAAASQPAIAQTTNWDGTTGVWSDSLRWDNGVPNSTTAVAQFLTGGSPFVSTIDGTFTVNQLNVNNANARVLANSGSTLTLGGTVPTATLTNGFFQIDGGTVSGGSWQLVDGEFTANGGLVQNTTFSTTGSGRVKIGNGFTTFSNVHFNTSQIIDFATNSPARMRISNGTTLGPTVLTFDGNAGNSPNTGVFAVDQTMDMYSFVLNLDGNARFEVENANTVTIVGTGSRIQMNAGAAKDGIIRISDSSGMFVNGSGGSIRSEVSGRTLTIEGSNFTNQDTIIASNGGTIVISPSNAFGSGTISATGGGVVQISDATNFAMYDAGSFTLTNGVYIVASGGTIDAGARQFRNIGGAVVRGSGSFIGLDGILTNILPTGLFDLSANYVVSNASSSFTNSGAINVGGGATLTIGDAINLTNFSGNTLTGGSWFFYQAGSIDLGSRLVTTIGAGTRVTISHAETPHPAFNSLAVNNGRFELSWGVGFNTLGSFINNGDLYVMGPAVFNIAASSTFTNNGLLNLSDGATMTLGAGSTLVNNSVMNVTTGATLNTSSPSVVQTGTATISTGATWGGAGKVTVQNTGVLRVDGSVNKNVTVDAGGRLQGRGVITGDVDLSGDLAPGDSAGTIKIDGSIVQKGSSTTTIEIGGVTPGTQHDQIIVTQSITLNGQLRLSFFDGFVPTFQDEFMILQAGSILGKWSNTPDDVYFGDNFRMNVNYASTFVSLSGFSPVPEPTTLALTGLGAAWLVFGSGGHRLRRILA